MFHPKLILLVATLTCMAYSSIVGRVGFQIIRKDWTDVIGKSVEEAKEIIKRELPDISFLVVDEEMYSHISEEGYLNKVILGSNSNLVVVQPAKYFGYVPNLDFAHEFMGRNYMDAVEAIKMRTPDLQIVVVYGHEIVYLCCESRFSDHVELAVDTRGLLVGITHKN